MKVKSVLLIVVIQTITCLKLTAQNVKIKKGEIFIDNVQKGFVTSDRKGLAKNKFFFLDLSKDTLFIVGYENIPSPIDTSTYFYQYAFVDVPKLKRRVHYPFRKKYYFTDNSIAEHFLQQKAITSEFTIDDQNMTVLLNASESAPPPRLVSILKNEQSLFNNIDFIAPRLILPDPKEMAKVVLEIIKIKSYSSITEFKRDPSYEDIDEYLIRQAYTPPGDQPTVMSAELGKIVVKSTTSIATKEISSRIFVYNVKGGLIAHLGAGTFGKLSIYNGNITQSFVHQQFNKDPSIHSRLKKLVNYLIQLKKI